MLERVALHQTRLRTPGMTVDAQGVALGAKGLVLLGSLDRLVTFLSLYSSSASLSELIDSLEIEVARSKLGHREVVLTVAADTTGRMDRIAEIARLAGGHTFTGTSRHFVQYRDAAAPFGYDASEITPTDAAIALYHTTFTQHYEPDRKLALAELVTRLEPRVAPSSADAPGQRWICAEAGLGAALIHYFVRSRVDASVAVAEWPPESDFDETPKRRYLFRLDEIPLRMVPLLRATPGIDLFLASGQGCAVELGYEHPINLRACPVFPADGLMLLRGAGRPPIQVNPLPTFGPVASFASIQLHEHPAADGQAAQVASVAVPLRLAPDHSPWQRVNATCVRADELGALRQIAYRLGPSTLDQTTVAFTEHGAYLMRGGGIEAIPVGEMFQQYHPNIMIAAGYTPVPAVAPEVLYEAFESPDDRMLFLHRDGRRVAVMQNSFVPLAGALLDAQSWSGTTPEAVVSLMTSALPRVSLTSPGLNPMGEVASAGPAEPGATTPGRES